MVSNQAHPKLFRAITGALRDNVAAHGHVAESSWVGSATKRIMRSLMSHEQLQVSLKGESNGKEHC